MNRLLQCSRYIIDPYESQPVDLDAMGLLSLPFGSATLSLTLLGTHSGVMSVNFSRLLGYQEIS